LKRFEVVCEPVAVLSGFRTNDITHTELLDGGSIGKFGRVAKVGDYVTVETDKRRAYPRRRFIKGVVQDIEYIGSLAYDNPPRKAVVTIEGEEELIETFEDEFRLMIQNAQGAKVEKLSA
jgi:hypothetical protein